jgi:hypothetical protein
MSSLPAGADDSWALVVIGDNADGVAAIGRADLTARTGLATRAARLGLVGLRTRLLAAARAAEGLAGPTPQPSRGAVVVPLHR